MRPTRTTALVFAAVTLAATVASSSPAAAFFFPIGLVLGGASRHDLPQRPNRKHG